MTETETVYRCPNGHEEWFKADVLIAATEYAYANGEVFKTEYHDSDTISAMVCGICKAEAIEGED